MSDSGPIQKIKLRAGQFEFEAEGPSELIGPQFDAFIALVNAHPQGAPNGAAAPAAAKTANSDPPKDPSQSGAAPPAGASLGQSVLDRVFQVRGDSVSLLALPADAADALIVLLYGYLRLKGMQNVTGFGLMAAAKQSGVPLPRVDRVIDAKMDYITAGGAKRGRRYGLNNRGVKYAEEIIGKLVQ